MLRFFVTGTDTGVGKTTVSCALLAAARARGNTAIGIKPVETGCARAADGRLMPEDATALARAAAGRDDVDPMETTVYALRAPLSPSVAAEMEEVSITLKPMIRVVAAATAKAPDLLLVEGAGGLLVPLTPELVMADLALALDLPLLVVARDGLGTINHSLLTVEAAARRGLRVAAIILNAAESGTPEEDSIRNAAEIRRRSGVPVIGCLPHLPGAPVDALAVAAASELDLDLLE